MRTRSALRRSPLGHADTMPHHRPRLGRLLALESLERRHVLLCALPTLEAFGTSPVPAAANVSSDSSGAIPLGPSTYLKIDGLDPSVGQLLYRCETTRGGFLTVESLSPGAPDETLLTLFDKDSQKLIDAHGRIDWPSQAGLTYYISLTGTATDVDLRLTNLVSHTATTVAIAGTDGDDQFEFSSGASRRVAIGGVQYDFLPSEAAVVVFNGGGGANTAVISGTPDTETVTLRPGSATLRRTGLDVTIFNASEIIANSGGGTDIARFYDTSGYETFIRPDVRKP